MAASASPGTTISTSTSVGSCRIARSSALPTITESASHRDSDWRTSMGIETAEEGTEDLEAFRLRARAWLADNMPRLKEGQANHQLMALDEMGTRARELQRILFDGGFAGLCFPKEYGGQGLTRAHQIAFTQETAPYEMPVVFNIPTFSDRKSTRLNSSHLGISYAVFCLKK